VNAARSGERQSVLLLTLTVYSVPGVVLSAGAQKATQSVGAIGFGIARGRFYTFIDICEQILAD